MVRGFLDNSGLLVTGTVTALVWANIARESYGRFAHALEFVVNDIGMAFFFALAAKEVLEATAPGGALHSPRRSAVPLIAAVGGMVGPALMYLALVFSIHEPRLIRGCDSMRDRKRIDGRYLRRPPSACGCSAWVLAHRSHAGSAAQRAGPHCSSGAARLASRADRGAE